MKSRTGIALVTALAVPLFLHASSADAKGRPRATRTVVTGQVNLNTASVEQIKLLPRMRLPTAQAIVEHRAKQRFVTIRDVLKVKGIGQKTFLRLKPHLTVSGPNTLQRIKPAKATRGPKAASGPTQPLTD
jgi:competence protein ComEA